MEEYFAKYSNVNGVNIQKYNVEISKQNGKKLSYDSLIKSLVNGSLKNMKIKIGELFLQFSKSLVFTYYLLYCSKA